MWILLRPAAVFVALALTLGAAGAQQPQPPTAPVPPAAPPSASHLAVAREVALTSGIVRSIDVIPPQLFERLREQVVARPEISKDLTEVLKTIEPEMDLQKQRVIGAIAAIYARAMTEAELKDTIAFFRSPAGKKYVETQPAVLDDLVREMQLWSQELAEYVMVRVRAEMQKKGHQLQ
ncbi:MAG TPA: DUF2059 domain-containing protein [Beijerinckiaceae bacterium]|jgi:hypothetical protein